MVLLEGVGRRYEVGGIGVVALEGIDLEVDEGEFAVVWSVPAAARRRS